MSGTVAVIANDLARYTMFSVSLNQIKSPPNTRLDWGLSTDIAGARNTLVQRALEEGSEWVFFLDDDHVFPAGRAHAPARPRRGHGVLAVPAPQRWLPARGCLAPRGERPVRLPRPHPASRAGAAQDPRLGSLGDAGQGRGVPRDRLGADMVRARARG